MRTESGKSITSYGKCGEQTSSLVAHIFPLCPPPPPHHAITSATSSPHPQSSLRPSWRRLILRTKNFEGVWFWAQCHFPFIALSVSSPLLSSLPLASSLLFSHLLFFSPSFTLPPVNDSPGHSPFSELFDSTLIDSHLEELSLGHSWLRVS